jgi:hypothetical protein
MTDDYLLYYDSETYLFTTVRERFRQAGKLDAFDLFSIIVWKANRAKSKIARRLIAKCGTLEVASESFTTALTAAQTPQTRLSVAMQEWGFYLPMASAILTVLWPGDFTVYDVRVCDELRNFHSLGNLTKADRIWTGYQLYCEAVAAAVPGNMNLRDKDRFLWGRSAAKQLSQDILDGFPAAERPTG